MTHIMHLLNSVYDSTLNGTKKVEIRLLDDKRKKIKVGDTIQFINNFNPDKSFNVKVTKLRSFKDLNEVMNRYSLKIIYKDDSSYEEFIDVYNSIYTLEEQDKYSVLAIEFKLI